MPNRPLAADVALRFSGRVRSAVRRRARYAWRCCVVGRPCPTAELAYAFLARRDVCFGEPGAETPHACPAVTAGSIETLLTLGCPEAARRRTRWLLSIQRPDGSMPDSPGQEVVFTTLHAARALSAAAGEPSISMPEVEDAARRAWEFLDDPAPTVRQGVAWNRTARRLDMLLTLGHEDKAREQLSRLAWRQSGMCDADLAHFAALGYRLGLVDPADRAMAFLSRRRNRKGVFRPRTGRAIPVGRLADVGWTAKHYLDAAVLQVRASFDVDRPDLPHHVAADDGRFLALRDWFAALPADARVADVGCGSGRFCRRLLESFPKARLTGVDLAPAALERLPKAVAPREGSLLRTGLADDWLDGAFAVESLEHSLLPELALAELCRIVRPGGRVLVIDKRRAKQPLSEHAPWERWFSPRELAVWLARHCDQVCVRSITHDVGPSANLFLAAEGTVR